MYNFMSVKDNGGKEIIMEVGLAVIGVALLIVFRKQISDLTESLVKEASNKINALFGNATNGTI